MSQRLIFLFRSLILLAASVGLGYSLIVPPEPNPSPLIIPAFLEPIQPLEPEFDTTIRIPNSHISLDYPSNIFQKPPEIFDEIEQFFEFKRIGGVILGAGESSGFTGNPNLIVNVYSIPKGFSLTELIESEASPFFQLFTREDGVIMTVNGREFFVTKSIAKNIWYAIVYGENEMVTISTQIENYHPDPAAFTRIRMNDPLFLQFLSHVNFNDT